jgi:S-formylglutathione hydrolase FrmB
MMVSRRTYRRRRRRAVTILLVLAVAAGVLVGLVVSAGKDTDGARLVHYTITSRLVHQSLPQVAVIPAGNPTHARPLLVFLHGKGENEESNLVPEMFSALKALGSNAPDIVFPYGGEDSYWHDRSDGAWGEYVMREVIPQALRRLHADPNRIAIGGLSMGGFGAYDLALENPSAFCAVGGDSAALWRSGGETAAGAFDNAEDFLRNNVIGAARSGGDAYRDTSLWLDVGSEDPFRSADAEFAGLLRADGLNVRFHIWPGRHEHSYWDSHWRSYLHFYASALASCRRS